MLFHHRLLYLLPVCGLAAAMLATNCPGSNTGGQSVKPYAVPEWLLKDCRPAFVYSDTDAQLKENIDAGVTAVFNVPAAFWFGDDTGIYNWEKGKKVHVDLKQIRAGVERVRKAGVKTIGHIPPFWETEVLAQHPDWQWLTTPDAKPFKDPKVFEPGNKWPAPMGCWYSPFGDFYIDKIVFLAQTCGWGGQILDGFGGTYTACYCKHCKEGYKKATGREIPKLKSYPAPPDVSDPEYRRYIKWRLEEYDGFVGRWMKALKEADPNNVFTPWSTGPGRWWHWTYAPLVEHSDRVNRIVDAPIVELLWDFPPNLASNLMPSFTCRYYRGVTRENPAIMCTYFRSQGQQWAIPPEVENDFRLFTVVTNGCVPFVITYVINKTSTPAHYMQEIKARQPWTDGAKSVKWAAMLVSQNSRLLYGISSSHGQLKGGVIGSGVDTPDASKVIPSERRIPAHMESAVGVFRAAQEEHLPLDIIIDDDLDDPAFLSHYKVLVLPNAACLSDKAVDSIRRFVKNGGGLVALHETSLYNDYGDRRKDFALGDVFGATFEAVDDHAGRWPDFGNSCVVTFSPHQITDDPVVKANFQILLDHLDFIGIATRVKAAPGAQVIVSRSRDKETVPFLMLSEHGKGKVAYFAADIGQSYYTTPYQYERKLITNAIQWAARDMSPVRVTAPMCVQATFYEQEDGKRTIVHLLNELNTTTDRALPEGNVSLREEIVPLADIGVLFRDSSIRRVHLEPEAQDLPITRTDEGVQVTVPKLGLHSMVVAER